MLLDEEIKSYQIILYPFYILLVHETICVIIIIIMSRC